MPANALFLDTQGWLALLNTRDRLHSFASAEWQRRMADGYSVLLTDWIIAETGNGLARTSVRDGFAESAKAILVDPRVQLVYVSPELLARAICTHVRTALGQDLGPGRLRELHRDAGGRDHRSVHE